MAGTESPPTRMDALKRGQDAALDAMRKFTDTIEETLGASAEDDSTARKVASSVFEMVEQLLTIQYKFMRNMIGISREAVKDAKKAPGKASTQRTRSGTRSRSLCAPGRSSRGRSS